MGPVAHLVEGSGLSAKMFTDALQFGLRRWERAANITFVQTTNEDSANILVGAQLRPRGIAYTDVSVGDERSGEYRLIERARVCLNPERWWMMGFDGKLDTYDLVHTLTHEVGHAIGLGHPNGRDHVMSLQYRETQLNLSVGDIKGLRGIYGRAPEGYVTRQRSLLDVRVGALR
jgi:predicted Zn-dependent protease